MRQLVSKRVFLVSLVYHCVSRVFDACADKASVLSDACVYVYTWLVCVCAYVCCAVRCEASVLCQAADETVCMRRAAGLFVCMHVNACCMLCLLYV